MQSAYYPVPWKTTWLGAADSTEILLVLAPDRAKSDWGTPPASTSTFRVCMGKMTFLIKVVYFNLSHSWNNLYFLNNLIQKAEFSFFTCSLLLFRTLLLKFYSKQVNIYELKHGHPNHRSFSLSHSRSCDIRTTIWTHHWSYIWDWFCSKVFLIYKFKVN